MFGRSLHRLDAQRYAATLVMIGVATILVNSTQHSVLAGKFNRRVDLGDQSPDWIDLPSVNGKSYGLQSFADRDVLAILFTSAECPVARVYEGRLKKLVSEFEHQSFALVAVNSNRGETIEIMTQHANESEFNFVYLRDETQELAKKLGATCTPHVFLLNKERKIVYMGAIDDAWKSAAGVTHMYLHDAIKATLAGRNPETPETKQVGCGIRW